MKALCRGATHSHAHCTDMASCAPIIMLLLCAVFALVAVTEAQQGDKCLQHGGICMVENDCPPGNLSNKKGLCDEKGHECCHGLPMSERRCRKRGGECRKMSACSRDLWDEHALDCNSGEACCVLVF